MPALYFSGEKLLVFIQFPLFQNPILGQILSEVQAAVAVVAAVYVHHPVPSRVNF